MTLFKLSDTMIAQQEDYLGLNDAIADCGCNASSSHCGNNNYESTGDSSPVTLCGANHTAKDSPSYNLKKPSK